MKIMIIRFTCVKKLRIRLENFKGVFARVSMASDRLYFVIRFYRGGKICVAAGHVTSRDQDLYSNDQGRKRRETLGTRLNTYKYILWNNKEIKIDGQSVFYKHFFDKNIIYTNYLLYEMTNIESFNIVRDGGLKKSNF